MRHLTKNQLDALTKPKRQEVVVPILPKPLDNTPAIAKQTVALAAEAVVGIQQALLNSEKALTKLIDNTNTKPIRFDFTRDTGNNIVSVTPIYIKEQP